MEHQFTQRIYWKNQNYSDETANRRAFKNHSVTIDGKMKLKLSAAKTFKGDATLHNPEDLLLSSLASCHMMSYLYCCEVEKIEILKYEDQPIAFLQVNSDGSGKISKVILKPKVWIKEINAKELAYNLHQKAKQLCFIANSCNFEIEHQIEIII